MKTSRFQLICTLMVVALICLAYAGLTADQTDWAAQIGAGVCDYTAIDFHPPGDPPGCGPCNNVTGCPKFSSSYGCDGRCVDTGVNTGFRNAGLVDVGWKIENRAPCIKNWIGGNNPQDCVCNIGAWQNVGRHLQKCVLSAC